MKKMKILKKLRDYIQYKKKKKDQNKGNYFKVFLLK